LSKEVDMTGFDTFVKGARDAANSIGASAANIGEKISESVDDATERSVRFHRFADTGHDLFVTGAVTSHGGNLSESDGCNIWITRSNSMLGRLESDDVLTTTWNEGPSDEGCSRELVVHRAIHKAFQGPEHEQLSAVVHAHTRYTIALSLVSDVIVPIDSEGKFLFGSEGCPVVTSAESIGSEEFAEKVAGLVSTGTRAAVLKGHGPFAVAESLDEALRLVSVLEASCQILAINSMLAAGNR
jgi:L-fuculose-phosphate aldolase